LEVLEFELRALGLASQDLSLEPLHQPLLLWFFWRWGRAFCPGWSGLISSYFQLPVTAGMMGTHHHTQLFSV
jgi:hypothetical protein